MSALELVVDLPFLASEVNDAHRQVTFHARGMLLEAKRAGDALLAAKGRVEHGKFKAWVKANCRASYDTVVQYMRVAKLAATKNVDLHTFEGGVRTFLEAHAKPRITPPSSPPVLTPEAAERFLKINDRVERGEGAERAVAASRLAQVAEVHGEAPEALLERAKAMCPGREKSVYQAEVDQKVEAAEERLEKLQVQLEAFQKREALILKLMEHSDDERLEMLADALLRIEELEDQ